MQVEALARRQQRRLLNAAHAASPTPPDGFEAAVVPAVADAFPVVLAMLRRVAALAVEVNVELDEVRRLAPPFIKTATKRDGTSGLHVARLLRISPSAVSKAGRDARLVTEGPLEVEERLRELGERREAAETRRTVTQAMRWWWARLGYRIGLSDSELAEAAGVSKRQIQKDREVSETRAAEFEGLLTSRHALALLGPSGAGDDDLTEIAARVMLDYALEQRTDDAATMHGVAWLLMELGWSDRSVDIYARAAKAGSACSAHNLAYYYWQREEPDLERAEVWFRLAERHLHACANATLFAEFLEQQERHDEAFELLRTAVERGVAGSASATARFLCRRDQHDREGPWWMLAAEQGDPAGMRHRGRRAWDSGDVEEADRWYARAADAGDRSSAAWMGKRLLDVDRTTALRYLQTASAAGDSSATETLIGVWFKSDRARALNACRRLIAQGERPPDEMYAKLLEQADGSTEALQEAYRLWSELAETGGHSYHLSAARLARQVGEVDHARELLWRALECRFPDVVAAAARSLAELDREPGQSLLEALEVVADDANDLGQPQIAFAIADSLDQVGRGPQAVDILRRARAASKDSQTRAELEAEQIHVAGPNAAGGDVLREAVRRWKRCAKDGSRRALRYLAAHYVTARDHTSATAYFERLVELGEPYHRELAEGLWLGGDVERARAVCEEGKDEDEVDCYDLLGRLSEDPDVALDNWLRGAALGSWEAAVSATVELRARGHLLHARDCAERAAELSPCGESSIGVAIYPEEPARAVAHFRNAMERGCYHGAYNLAFAGVVNTRREVTRLDVWNGLRMLLGADEDDFEAALLLAEFTKDDPDGPDLRPVLYEQGGAHEHAQRLIALGITPAARRRRRFRLRRSRQRSSAG